MKPFLSSTFRDLADERTAVLRALDKKRSSTLAMEYFLASPTTSHEVALEHLRQADVMILVIGSKAGSLLPDGSGGTYTSAEYDELMKLGKEALVFVKEEKRWWKKRPEWRNKENNRAEHKALDEFKNRVGAQWHWDTFTTPEGLALAVVEALDAWESRGRPGARKTFATVDDYFSDKNPSGPMKLLDFGTTLLGRDGEMRALRNFAASATERVLLLSGRGGIGKSKLLYDWAKICPENPIFLKDEPLWYEDSEKEIPTKSKIIVIDDAHRRDDLGRILQLIQESPAHRGLKLVVSTRPGGIARVAEQMYRRFDRSAIVEIPELKELTKQQSIALAEEVLGLHYRQHAEHLAIIGSNSPMVIVAGGRLIATQKINPSALGSLEDFRTKIFNSFLQELNLHGPSFAMDPPSSVLHLIAALGPVDVQDRRFQESAARFFGRPIDEVLRTIDALANNGIVTPRPKPVRIIPDVLADFILEKQCFSTGMTSTRYAERVYDEFGAHSLKNLMRNLAELDWRVGEYGSSETDLLDPIWADIHQRFRAGDEYERHRILSELTTAAIYQPRHVMGLIRTAIADPVQAGSPEGSSYRVGNEYVISALPPLLEAVAHHIQWLPGAINTLWELSRYQAQRDRSFSSNAKGVLERLASWHRFGNPAFTFAVLIHAVRLASRVDAFENEFTPLSMIASILEREGHFDEMVDENTFSFGSFGLNHKVVGPVRNNAIDFLETALQKDGPLAYASVDILEGLLHNGLNRAGRVSSDEEVLWQNEERSRAMEMLRKRFSEPAGPLLKAKIYSALRSGTGIYCPPVVHNVARGFIDHLDLEDAPRVIDAICTAPYNLPILSPDFDGVDRDRRGAEHMRNGRLALERMRVGPNDQAASVVDIVVGCRAARAKTEGFSHFVQSFADSPDFLVRLAEQLEARPDASSLINELNSTVHVLRNSHPAIFRERAWNALHSGFPVAIRAIALNSLRAFDNATEEDVQLIKAYGGYPDPDVKKGALFAIAYMGKFIELRPHLLDAALSIDPQDSAYVASELGDAFGPYGVPLTMLSRGQAATLASRFLRVKDWDKQQGDIPRFLSSLVILFPDEVFALLMERVALSTAARANHDYSYHTFSDHHPISFESVDSAKRTQLATVCLDSLLNAPETNREQAELFWVVGGYGQSTLDIIVPHARGRSGQAIKNIGELIDTAIPSLAYERTDFVKALLAAVDPSGRAELVEELANQSGRIPGGVFAGDADEFMSAHAAKRAAKTDAISSDPDIQDLTTALRRRQ